MSARHIVIVVLLSLSCIMAGCANIVPPSGGKKDTKPPVLKSITPKDSLLNTRVRKIEMNFDEFITVNDVATQVQISPLLSVPLSVIGMYKKVTIKIPDTLLQDNTTYRISLGTSIRDLHEGNVFPSYTYTFSTGSYFDSLQLSGKVIVANKGMPDSGAKVLLYNALKSDSAVVREKPSYVTTVNANGDFNFKGLPPRRFKIYAIHESNNNLIYDAPGESIGFVDSIALPADTVREMIMLYTFVETEDTSAKNMNIRMGAGKDVKDNPKEFSYKLPVDTFDNKKRTQDILHPITINFNRIVGVVNNEKILLQKEVGDKVENVPVVVSTDSLKKNTITITCKWEEDKKYILKLQKSFAKDTSGKDALPGKFVFRTKSDDDFAVLNVHVPSKYRGNNYVLLVHNETDTVYQKMVTDTLVKIKKLVPASYTVKVIVDENKNGKWDKGDLFKKLQPEKVIPYKQSIPLKAGWDNTVDIEEVAPGRKGAGIQTSPQPAK